MAATPPRIQACFEVLALTDKYRGGVFFENGENVVPPRELTPPETGMRSAAIETLARYILGDVECQDHVLVVPEDAPYSQLNQYVPIRNSKQAGDDPGDLPTDVI